ncbi:MAG: isoleucine--tRNA ligase [Verrucomicrobiota bacterium]|nr:isoleucine--tRNA ligase [Verrucomicrobiota bacterium]
MIATLDVAMIFTPDTFMRRGHTDETPTRRFRVCHAGGMMLLASFRDASHFGAAKATQNHAATPFGHSEYRRNTYSLLLGVSGLAFSVPMTANYKDTLNLPKTDFPMKADLPKREPTFLDKWNESKIYDQILADRKGGTEFILHDGPPFANGDAHMGHALNMTLKDLVLKYRNMTGHHVPFVPGWDCHGLPIEFKVTKELGSKARGMSSAEIRQLCDAYARKYIAIQREQFKRLGVFGEWENPYLTINPVYEAEVLRLFADIVDKGLVYQSKKPVSWSTGAQTALAEAEVEYHDHETPAIYVKFEAIAEGLTKKTFLVIWTTTPWTLPANLAVAVRSELVYAVLSNGAEDIIVADALSEKIMGLVSHAGYQKSGQFTGKDLIARFKYSHPFLDRTSPILAGDSFVTTETGSGLVHIAPGHGKDDYDVAKHLGILSPVNDYGKFTEEVGVPELVNKYVFDSNRYIIDEILTRKGLLLHEEKFQHTYPFCWRSKTPIVFRAVEQWFIRIDQDGLKKEALREIDTVKWIPDWGKNRISGAVESRGDWCISRQRTWGVPLPILYRNTRESIVDAGVIRKLADIVEKQGTNVWFENDGPALALLLGLENPDEVSRKIDTIDVWIDSGSSHRALAKTHPHVRFPADLYLEGSDQHRGWFQSSLLTSVASCGKAPYKAVVTNGFVVDIDGKKLSKSGTYQKPTDLMSFINKYGADVLRLWVASENYQTDVPWSEEIFTHVSDTYRRIRNTFRILLANITDFDPENHSVDLVKGITSDGLVASQGENDLNDLLVDRWVLSRLQSVVEECLQAYESYEFHRVYHAVNSFCAVELSSLYVDITKDRMYCDKVNSLRRRGTQTVMYQVLSALTRIMAPVMPFTTEETWAYLDKSGKSVHRQLMPKVETSLKDTKVEELIQQWLKIRDVSAIELEKARQAKLIGKSVDARVVLTLADSASLSAVKGKTEALAEFLIVSQVDIVEGPEIKAEVATPRGQKCARSWRWHESVGLDPEYPDLTPRDVDAVRSYVQKV